VVQQMLATGEEAGRLESMMLCACGMLERDVERFLDSVAGMLEPLVLVGVGSVVAVITAAAFLPNIALLEAL